MISAQQAVESLNRLATLKHFPTREAVIAEVGRLLNELCQTDGEARHLTSVALKHWSEWGGPGALRKLYQDVIVASRPQPAGCDLCDGSGFRPVTHVQDRLPDGSKHSTYIREVERQHAASKTHEVYLAMAFCACPLGHQQREAAHGAH